MPTACHYTNRIKCSAVSTRKTTDMNGGTQDMKLSVGGCFRSVTMGLGRRGGAKLSNSGQTQTTEEEEAAAETSRLRAEFRLAVVGHLVVGDVERGELVAELKSLSAKKWKHPITGKRVTFGYSTIEHWYYVALNNPKVRLRVLSKRRRDAGLPRSLTKQVRYYLARQAKRHSSWIYRRHHETLVRHMKEREWGRTPSCSTVRRYLQSACYSQNIAVDAKIKKLEGLVVHLRRTLIVESTIIRLLRVPELRANTVGPPFKFSRLGPSEKAYVLSRVRDYQSTGGSQSEFCTGIGISQPTIERWGALYRRYSEAGLCTRTRRKFPNRANAREIKAQILEIFHSQPSTYGINRTSWTGESLAKALHRKHRVTISARTASRHLRESGHTLRRASPTSPIRGLKQEFLMV
jgi:transposase